jgi:hypothetical protein
LAFSTTSPAAAIEFLMRLKSGSTRAVPSSE